MRKAQTAQELISCALAAFLISFLVWGGLSIVSVLGFLALFAALVFSYHGLVRLWIKKVRLSQGDNLSVGSLKEVIVQTGLQKYERELRALAANSIFIHTAPPREAELPVGASRIGGLPDLPDHLKWPDVEGKPLVFLAQFDLSEVATYDKDGLLPTVGFLYFFYDDGEGSVWGFAPDDRNHWRVIFHPGPKSSLRRRNPPSQLLVRALFKECAARFLAQDTLPNERPVGMELKDESYFKLIELLGASTTHHQLLGHESPVQGDVKLECQLVSNGLYCGDASGYKDPRAAELRSGVKDWMLLFQIDSDDKPKMMWGDLGRLYFCIRKQDLSDRRFDQVWMVFQCY